MNQFEIIVLFIMSFLPPILYSIWIRNTEKYHREKWAPIWLSFLWGATIAVIASLILELTFGFIIFSFKNSSMVAIISIIIIAPFVEELTKPMALGLRAVREELDELEDGFIYGAVAGLGFSATENLFYGVGFLSEGFLYFLALISIRSFGACLLHASATALTGYGVSKAIIKKHSLLRILPYFLLAIFVHALYNSLLTLNLVGLGLGFFAALALAFFAIQFVRRQIIFLDNQGDKHEKNRYSNT
ncbi:MAG: hypothetical protein DRN33_03080 [Thermoplasmata archaeon]|nr:MAG: hypothetical protein DRN33_03080 [Thermoplasmata archaeon]